MQKKPNVLFAVFITLTLTVASNEKAYSQSISDEAGNTFGFAEMFTPQQNFTFSGLTLYVTDYYDISGPNSSTLSLGLFYDWNYEDPSYPFHEPYGDPLAEATATINDNTGPYYGFNLSASLQENVPYWFFLYLQSPDVGGLGVGCSWGGIPDITGIEASSPQVVLIDGIEDAVNGFDPGTYRAGGQTITINTVPEPNTNSLLWFGLLGTLFWQTWKRRTGRA